jgi:hypothetical protein
MDGPGDVVEPRADSWTQGGEAALDVGLHMREVALKLPEHDLVRDGLLVCAEAWMDCAALRGVLPPSPALVAQP